MYFIGWNPKISSIWFISYKCWGHKKCFGHQCKSHVVGFGGGIITKELKGGNSSKAALLDKLNAREKGNELL